MTNRNNPMSADLTKPDVAGAVERVTRFTDKSTLSIIDQISMIAAGEETVGSLVEDIRTILAELEEAKKEIAGLRAGDDYLSRVCSIVSEAATYDLTKIKDRAAEIERLRGMLSDGLDLSARAREALKGEA